MLLSCSLAGMFFPPPFHIFTISDKALVAFSIMLCGCSQQERVIALGVWSSLKWIGSSEQRRQVLPMVSPVCTCAFIYLCVPAMLARIICCHFFLLMLHNMHPFTTGDTNVADVPIASSQPAESVTVTVESPGPVNTITRALRPLEASRCLAITLQ